MSIIDKLFGGGAPDIDWGEFMRVIELAAQVNRTNTEGFFTGNRWSENEDGTWTNKQTASESFMPAIARMEGRLQGQGFEPYQSPNQFSHLLDAKMANQMDRHGDIPGWGIKMPDEGYGGRSRFREGRFGSDYFNAPPKNSYWAEKPGRVAWQPPPPPQERSRPIPGYSDEGQFRERPDELGQRRPGLNYV